MRRRLMTVSLAITTMVALAFVIPLMILTRQLAADRAISAAEQEAETVAQLLSTSPGKTPEAAFAGLGFDEVSLILPDGSVVGEDVPKDEDLSGPRLGAAGNQSIDGGTAVYVPVANSAGEIIVVRNFVENEELTRNVGRSWLILGSLAVALVGVAVLVAGWLGRSMVKPVEELSRAAGELGEGNLETRVTPSGPPEVAAVATEFNHLAGRVTELLQQERETAADLSHRLRTPLTAARLDAESLSPGIARERLLDDLAELERTIDHVIAEARRPARDADSLTDLAAITTERARFWEALAEEQGRTSTVTVATGPLVCRGDEPDITAAIDAVVGNVFSHTADGVAYSVALESIDGAAVLTVDDDGPGFGDGDAARRGVSGGGSTGLGLDIARRVAERAGGSLVLGTSGAGGARVVMTIPLTD
ncbi:MAG: HAMP domain-containing histidine kinase [Acidimicrobiia bacterium]|nr:HAMP domain-containing histidine kinase [Acidimicrobiia bacterium]